MDHFLTSFVELQTDKIVNVRLQLSQTLALVFESQQSGCRLKSLSEHPKLVSMVRRLRVDSNKDVAYYLRHVALTQEDNESTPEKDSDHLSELIEKSKNSLSKTE